MFINNFFTKRYYGNENYSSFWMGDSFMKKVNTTAGINHVEMASIKRAISNFVRITTGKNIPVEYSTKIAGATDGSRVYISADVDKDKNFDATVGLALHEGSHILLSNFNLLMNLAKNSSAIIPKNLITLVLSKKHDGIIYNTDAIEYIVPKLKDLLNYIEDRRIDYFIQENAPGYCGYYSAMYEKYFNSPKITAMMLVPGFASRETWKCYEFRIVNLLNRNTKLDALKKLQEVYDTIDLSNISRLTDSKDAFAVACKVFEIIENAVSDKDEAEETKEAEENRKNGEDGEQGDESENGEDSNSTNFIDELADPNGKISEADMKKALKDLEKMKDFIEGKVGKKKVTDEEQRAIQAVSESGVDIKDVGGNGSVPKTKVIVIKNMTMQLINSNAFNICCSSYGNQYPIDRGIQLGNMLGHKLQIRNEERSTVYNRLKHGKIDKRLVHACGFDSESIFDQIHIDKFNPVLVHISIDASGSMGGTKFEHSQIAVVAIAKAASMVSNLDVVIDYRATDDYNGKETPVVLIAYDSRKDDFSKVKNLFKYISCPGTTPEGLCFEAIQNLITAEKHIDKYFINFSDGEPYFGNYSGTVAQEHTRKEVGKMIAKGITILSYFIGGCSDGSVSDGFKRMYGKDATSIDTTQLVPLAKTLNKMFATKQNS